MSGSCFGEKAVMLARVRSFQLARVETWLKLNYLEFPSILVHRISPGRANLKYRMVCRPKEDCFMEF